MNLQLVPFDLSMQNECIELYQSVFTKEPWFDNDDIIDVERYFKNCYKSNQFIGYVVKGDAKIIGLSIGFSKPWIKGEEYYIDQFCIDYDLQGQGIGTFMINEMKKDLKRNNLNAILLNTERNYPAYEFYVKNGFKELDGVRFLGLDV